VSAYDVILVFLHHVAACEEAALVAARAAFARRVAVSRLLGGDVDGARLI
jgi:hypothetical protein